MSEVKRFKAAGPWITRELRDCVLASDYDALKERADRLADHVQSLEEYLEVLDPVAHRLNSEALKAYREGK